MVRDPHNTAGWAAEVSMLDIEDSPPFDTEQERHERLRPNEDRHVYEDEETIVADDLTSSEEGYIEPPD